jgi:hypothetical protein
MEEKTAVCYAVPKDGSFFLSVPLRAALEDYGPAARYRIAMDLFRNETQLDLRVPEERAALRAEMDRLNEAGMEAALETHGSGESAYAFLSLQLTAEQLQNFNAAEGYGYMLFLYDERLR